MYYRKNPTAYYYNRFIENIHPFYFNSSGIFHSINLYSNKSNKEINRLFSIIGVQTFTYEFNFSNLENYDLYIYNYCGKNDIIGVEKTFNTILTDNQKQLCIKQFYNKKIKKHII